MWTDGSRRTIVRPRNISTLRFFPIGFTFRPSSDALFCQNYNQITRYKEKSYMKQSNFGYYLGMWHSSEICFTYLFTISYSHCLSAHHIIFLLRIYLSYHIHIAYLFIASYPYYLSVYHIIFILLICLSYHIHIPLKMGSSERNPIWVEGHLYFSLPQVPLTPLLY